MNGARGPSKGCHRETAQLDLELIETQAFRLASALLSPAKTYPVEMRCPSFAITVSIKAQIKRLAISTLSQATSPLTSKASVC